MTPFLSNNEFITKPNTINPSNLPPNKIITADKINTKSCLNKLTTTTTTSPKNCKVGGKLDTPINTMTLTTWMKITEQNTVDKINHLRDNIHL